MSGWMLSITDWILSLNSGVVKGFSLFTFVLTNPQEKKKTEKPLNTQLSSVLSQLEEFLVLFFFEDDVGGGDS